MGRSNSKTKKNNTRKAEPENKHWEEAQQVTCGDCGLFDGMTCDFDGRKTTKDALPRCKGRGFQTGHS